MSIKKVKKDREFWESKNLNSLTYMMYYNRLVELAINTFEWRNLPDTVDERFLELTLFAEGQALFFYDDVLGFLGLQCVPAGEIGIYRIPTLRQGYAVNGYLSPVLDETNSVIIFNNFLHTNSQLDAEMYARRLYEIERAIDVNVKAQKTPVLIRAEEAQRLTMKNLYMQYDGNQPFIFGDKNLDIDGGLEVLNTAAPFVADKLNFLKRQIWSEALQVFGIESSTAEKRERAVTAEVEANLGSVEALRLTRLNARRQAADQINRIFGLDIEVGLREELTIGSQELESEEGVQGENEPIYDGA